MLAGLLGALEDRGEGNVELHSARLPASRRAAFASAWPCSVRSTSRQPVNRFFRFHSLCPWRTSTQRSRHSSFPRWKLRRTVRPVPERRASNKGPGLRSRAQSAALTAPRAKMARSSAWWDSVTRSPSPAKMTNGRRPPSRRAGVGRSRWRPRGRAPVSPSRTRTSWPASADAPPLARPLRRATAPCRTGASTLCR